MAVKRDCSASTVSINRPINQYELPYAPGTKKNFLFSFRSFWFSSCLWIFLYFVVSTLKSLIIKDISTIRQQILVCAALMVSRNISVAKIMRLLVWEMSAHHIFRRCGSSSLDLESEDPPWGLASSVSAAVLRQRRKRRVWWKSKMCVLSACSIDWLIWLFSILYELLMESSIDRLIDWLARLLCVQVSWHYYDFHLSCSDYFLLAPFIWGATASQSTSHLRTTTTATNFRAKSVRSAQCSAVILGRIRGNSLKTTFSGHWSKFDRLLPLTITERSFRIFRKLGNAYGTRMKLERHTPSVRQMFQHNQPINRTRPCFRFLVLLQI